MIDIDYYRSISIIGLSINYIWTTYTVNSFMKNLPHTVTVNNNNYHLGQNCLCVPFKTERKELI